MVYAEIAGIIRRGGIYGSAAFVNAHAAWLQQVLGRKNASSKIDAATEPGGIPPD